MYEVLIVGAGFAGLCMGIALRKAGVTSFTILEKERRLGGTWRDNTYPGAACDIVSHLYSFSFERKSDWSRTYAEQPEILAYLEHCARKYSLDEHIELDVEVLSLVWREDVGAWEVTDATGQIRRARCIVTATGQLNRPAYPAIPGLDSFAGPRVHSARWGQGMNLDDKRVALLGTGASAVQILPRVADRARHVALFQRTPPWILPKLDRGIGPLEKRLRALPGIQAFSRAVHYTWGESRLLAFRRDSAYNKVVRFVAQRTLHRAIVDARMRDELTPDYAPGCKRLLISNEYFETLARADVSLITQRIVRVEPHALVTAGEQGERRHEADVLILATGFEATKFLAPMTLAGRAGVTLEQAWRDGPAAYLGIAVPGFPNLFLLYGPNTNLAHNSIIVMLEAQVRYIVGCVQKLRRDGGALEVRPEPYERFMREMDQRFEGSVWDGCSSWYQGVTGRRHANNWPGSTLEYRLRVRSPRWSDYLVR